MWSCRIMGVTMGLLDIYFMSAIRCHDFTTWAMFVIIMCLAVIAFGSSYLVEAVFVFLEKFRNTDDNETE